MLTFLWEMLYDIIISNSLHLFCDFINIFMESSMSN